METLKQQLMTALVAAQAEMGNAMKDSANPFFKSKYADLTAVMEVVKPAFAKHELGFIQICHDATDSAKIETIIIHSSGETYSCGCVSVPVSKSDAQGYGSALTYARRYSLSSAVGVGAEDDDGNAATKAAPTKAFSAPHKGVDGAMESLPKVEQESIHELADELRIQLINGNASQAFRHLESQNLEPEQKVALWSLLKSNERSELKRQSEAAKLEKQFVE